jgi:hypothetical protein
MRLDKRGNVKRFNVFWQTDRLERFSFMSPGGKSDMSDKSAVLTRGKA